MERTDGDFPELGRGTEVLQIFFWVLYFIIFLFDQLNLRGLARNQLLPGHLSQSVFSAFLPLADLPASQIASVQVSPGPVSWRTRLCTFKITFCVGKDWDRLIHLKNYELSHGYFLCQPKGRLGESFSSLTGLGRYSSTKWCRRIFKVNTVKLISFSEPLSTPLLLPIPHPSLICLFFLFVSLHPFHNHVQSCDAVDKLREHRRNLRVFDSVYDCHPPTPPIFSSAPSDWRAKPVCSAAFQLVFVFVFFKATIIGNITFDVWSENLFNPIHPDSHCDKVFNQVRRIHKTFHLFTLLIIAPHKIKKGCWGWVGGHSFHYHHTHTIGYCFRRFQTKPDVKPHV